jgi:FkbM family methyltransferase
MFLRRRTTPLVSVIMPVFNQGRFCSAAIDSVRGQTLQNFELVIIDDGSTDDTGAILDAFAARDKRIRVVHRHHAGVSASVNLGIFLARSESLARLDGDDLCVENRLEVQLAFLAAHSNVAVVGSDMLAVAEDGRPVRRVSYTPGAADLHRLVLLGNPMAHPTIMARRSAIMKVGGYRRIFDSAEDYDLWLRISEHADLANIPKILVHYRMHGENTSSRYSKRQTFRAEVARLAAIRRRLGKSDPCDSVTVLDRAVLDLLELDAGDRGRMMAMLAEARREDRAHAAPARVGAAPMTREADEVAFETEIAVHPNWVSRLRLFPSTSRVEHAEHGSTGSYERVGDRLVVNWDKYPAEIFSRIGISFILDKILDGSSSVHSAAVPDLSGLASAKLGSHLVSIASLTVSLPGQDYEVSLRQRSSDMFTFQQVFLDHGYDSPNLPRSAACIFDLGANVGFTSVFFGLRYPDARIFALEPDRSNYAMLQRNVKRLGERAVAKNLAVWSEDGVLGLVATDEQGGPLGAWGVRTVSPDVNTVERVSCRSLPSLLGELGVDEIDILKVDIEGAELELFSSDGLSWLPKVKLLIVETHERFRPGSDLAVRKAVAGLFEELPPLSDNLWFRRK